MNKTLVMLCLLVATTHGFSQGTILWNESVDGSLSHDLTNPTSLTPVQARVSTVIGSVEITPVGANWVAQADYFLISVPSGLAVNKIQLQIDKPNVWLWIGSGSYVTTLGFASNPSPGDLLSQWGLNSLNQGTYAIYLQNHDVQASESIAHYRLDFIVPEPSSFLLILCGLGWLGFRSWTRRG